MWTRHISSVHSCMWLAGFRISRHKYEVFPSFQKKLFITNGIHTVMSDYARFVLHPEM